ncbi:hypothetical protein TNCV_4168151 [Trichonephila clavipes]|nr:hypothetical protein TNCV_4168151 [Trichonephila clavipes]
MYQAHRLFGINKECRVANAVVASYGAKKQKKRTEIATHLWDRKHFIDGQQVIKIRTRSRLTSPTAALHEIPYVLEDFWHVTYPLGSNRFER